MSDSVLAGTSLILYTGKNYAGTQQSVTHGVTGELAASSASWDYASAAMSSMQVFIFSDVSTADASASYLGHAEDLLSTSVSDLTALYPSATQFPLNFLGLNPAIATLVRLVIDPEQAAPDAVASTAQVGGSTTNITTLSLQGHPGALGFVSLTEGSSVVATCPYGTYNSADGTIDWSGKMGSVALEYTGGRIVVVSTSGFPDGWDFGAPEQQADGSWTVALNGGVPAGNEIAAISASPASIVNDGSSASVITASVVNANGLPVSGVTVNWSTTAGSLSVASSVTSANGKATTSLTDSGAAGLVTVTAAISGSSKSTQVTVTDSKAGYVLASLAADKNTLLNDGTDLVKLTATVKDGSGNLISGVPVYWSTTLGTLNHAEQDSDTVGESHAKLTDTGDTGTASITARLDDGSSKQTTISIQNSGAKELLIMGARSSNRAYGEYIESRLVALDKQTFAPVIADWNYDGQQEVLSATNMIDVYPGKILNISASGYASVALNVSNVIGSGGWYDENDDPGSHGAFAARKNSGDIVVWGEDTRGAIPPLAEDNYGASFLCASAGAFAAIRGNNTIFSWGNVDDGGETPADIKTQAGIIDVRSSRGTFLIRSTVSPYIQTWGRGVTTDIGQVDLTVPAYIASKSDIQRLQMTEDAACAINQAGQVYTWGDASCGGSITSDIQSLTGVTACYSSRRAFAVLFNNGMVKAWGDTAYGGDASAVSGITDIVRVCATESAFLALRRNGQIVAWGEASQGASIPTDYKNYTDIVDIKSSYGAFAALRSNGQVICWGEKTHGGNSSDTTSFTNVIAITGTSWSFAALHKDGTVSAWGNSSYGGDTTAVKDDLVNVCAIYPNSRAFFALKTDGSFVAWGDSISGGDQTKVPSSLTGNITYLA
ncbi:Ig-like domain-containing protein [Citrobacter youngae]|uniref:Bacterial group 1 Ig-like protein n=1 Tax=Citrobacter youngae ATCC 29220 TaxID=500640 RepID=D4BBY7_9ENTR|nr:Ig-like domain-containing protein [Citrobacter youngae]EFE08605.1 bacterial group 1 Ig-like protein [Citrobacter youngae ATCC 29220]